MKCRAPAFMLLVGAASACADLKWIAGPSPPEGARSAIIAYGDPVSSVAHLVEAIDLVDGQLPTKVAELEVDFIGPIAVSIAFYADPLSANELGAGRLSPATEPRRCELEAPMAVVSTQVGGEGGWVSIESLPTTLRTHLTGESCRPALLCRPMRIRGVDLADATRVQVALPHDGDVFVATTLGMYRVTQTEALPLGPPPIEVSSGFAAPDGTLWLGGILGSDPAYAVGTPEGGFQVSLLANARGRVRAMAGRQHADGLVVLALAGPLYNEPTPAAPHFADLHVLRQGRWSTPYAMDFAGVRETLFFARWLGDDHALASYGGYELLEYDAGAVRTVQVFDPQDVPPIHIRAIGVHSLWGLALGGSTGRMHVPTDGLQGWIPAPLAAFSNGVSDLGELGRAWIVANKNGLVSQYWPEGAPCPEVPTPNQADRLLRVGDRFLVSGDPEGPAPTKVGWVEVD